MFGGFIPALLGTVTVAGIAALVGIRHGRIVVYRSLTEKIAQIQSRLPAVRNAFAFRREIPDFLDRFAVVPDFLPGDLLEAVRTEIGELDAERSFIPGHKQGGTVAYEHLIACAPAAVGFYHNAEFQNFISRMTGCRVRPTPVRDQSSLSVLMYKRPGDHIGWHYDHNFYRGRHFTVLLIIRNEGAGPNQLSHGALVINHHGKAATIPAAANSLVVFEGARILHMVTPVRENETRIVLSMTYCTDDRAWWWQDAARRLKDTAFFGVRAIWT